MAPCWRPKFSHPWDYPPKQKKTCPRSGQTAVQNFTPIAKAPAEKSVTVHNEKMKYTKLSILPYTTYRGINILIPLSFRYLSVEWGIES